MALRRFSDAIARAEEAIAWFGDTGSDRTRADLAATLAAMQDRFGASEPALAWAEVACTLAERLDDSELLGRAVGAKAAALFHLGRHREAVMLARGRVALIEGASSLVEQGMARLHASLYLVDDDPHEAISLQLESAELARRAGARSLETGNLLNAAEGAMWLGQWDEARAALNALGQRELASTRQIHLALVEAALAALSGETALAFERLATTASTADSEDTVSRSNYYLIAALVHLAADDIETSYSDAVAAVAAEPSGINSPTALAIQMRAALWLGDLGRASEALAGMQGFRGRWMAAVRLTGEAGLAALQGRYDDASTVYARALDAWRALDSPLDLAFCALDRAILRGASTAPGDEDDEAREIFTRIGAQPLLDRLDRTGAAARKVG